MQLSRVLLRYRKTPNGNIWTGKNRMVREVTIKDVLKLSNDFAIEENNMFLLRHSYLTPEQSFGHARDLGKNEANLVKLLHKKKEFKANVTVEEVLGHLRYKEAWD